MQAMYVLAGMAMVWAGWAIFGATCVGLGSLLLLVLTCATGKWRCGTAFWCGFAALIFILQVTNLFSGIGPRTSAVLTIVGLCGLFVYYSRIAFFDIRSTFHWNAIPLLCILVWLSNRALQTPLVDDSGIYHFSSIRWANTFPLPPGLGNLHGHLAFNQSYFLFVAFLNNFPIPGFGHNLANSLLFAAGILTIFENGGTMLGSIGTLSLVRLQGRNQFCFRLLLSLLLPVTLFFLATCNRSNPPFISSPSPDAAVFVVEIVLAAYLLDLSFRRDGVDRSTTLTAIVCLASASITLKLSSLGFAAATLFCCVALAVRHRNEFGSIRAVVLATFAAVLATVWVIRSVVASGYLIYPLVVTGVPVDWKVPEHLVHDEFNGIWGWARLPVYQSWKIIGSWNWLPGWLLRMADRPDIVAPLGLIAVCGFCWLFARKHSVPSGDSPVGSSLFVVGLTSLAYWFWNAPDPRFLGASLWVIVLWAVGKTVYLSPPENLPRISRIIVFLFWASVVACFVRNGLALTISTGDKFAQPIPTPALTRRTTRSGLVVYTPLPGSYCWDWKLPCTPFFRPQLRLRGHSLANGFYIDETTDRAPDF
jgi:hypothetical protein